MVFLTGHTTTSEREAGMVVVLRGKLVNLIKKKSYNAYKKISITILSMFIIWQQYVRFLSLFLFHSSNLIFFLLPSSLSIHPSLTLTFIDLICCPSLVKPPLFTLRTLSLWCLSFFPSLLFFHFPFIVGVSHFCFHPSFFLSMFSSFHQ